MLTMRLRTNLSMRTRRLSKELGVICGTAVQTRYSSRKELLLYFIRDYGKRLQATCLVINAEELPKRYHTLIPMATYGAYKLEHTLITNEL
jgi:hypothetical protein